MRALRHASRPKTWLAVLATAALALAACGGGETATESTGQVNFARVDDNTQWFQAEIHRQLLIELGYQVTAPATVAPNTFYPALSSGQYDLWADYWDPNHTFYQTEQDITGGSAQADVTRIERQSDLQIVQGYMVDKATADELGITSIEDFADPAVAEAFDRDGDGKADLVGCNEGWGCNLITEAQIAEFDWGDNVNHVVGDFFELQAQAFSAFDDGESILYFNWMPNWSVERLVPGSDAVWLEAPALPDSENTTVEGIEGCASDPCNLGFTAAKVDSAVNTEFLDAHPDIGALLEVVDVPAADISAQNVEMNEAGDGYSAVDLENAAKAWIADNRDAVDGWLDTARAAS